MKEALSVFVFLCFLLPAADGQEEFEDFRESGEDLQLAEGEFLDFEELDIEKELAPWTEEDLIGLRTGEYAPGSRLIGGIAWELLFSGTDEVIQIDPDVRNLPDFEAEEPEDAPTTIDPAFFARYFHERPSRFLNDPQSLLTSQEFSDREGFLRYHARDTETDLYIYLFGEKQEIPDGFSATRVVQENFGSEESLAVVFYFLGAPERAKVVFSDAVIKAVPGEERYKVLEMAIEEAQEMSEVVSQLESFSMQLSKRLYWMEKVIARYAGDPNAIFDIDPESLDDPVDLLADLKQNPILLSGVLGALIIFPATVIFFLWRWLRERSKVYLFPEVEGGELFQAPYAAGIGGVISFSSSTISPSHQKSETPDFLQRM